MTRPRRGTAGAWHLLFRVPLAVILGLGLGLSACGDDTINDPYGPVTEVSMTEYAFSPAPLTLDGDGDLHITNDGAETHNLTIPALGKGIELGPGEDGSLQLANRSPGTYPVICDIAGHADKGMKTELTIR